MSKPAYSMGELAPLHAQMDPAYPQALREIAEVLYVQLVEDEPAAQSPAGPERLAQLAFQALRLTERLSAEFAGHTRYFSKGVSYRASVRDRQMYAQFNGRNYDELARTHHISPMRVRQIMGAMLADDLALRQGQLALG